MNKLNTISMLLALCLCFVGCDKGSSNTESGVNSDEDSTVNTAEPIEVDFSSNDSDMFSNRDYEVGFDESSSAIIELNGDSASCNVDSVSISDGRVTITDEGTYIISGTLNDGMIIVDADETDKLQIVLNGVSVTSSTSAPLYIINGDKVFVTLADGSENTLANGGSFVAIDDNNIDGAVFSKQDLTFNGSGALTVTSPAGHGIVCKDDLVFTSGTYTVSSASHGLDVNDSARIVNASISIVAGKDGIHSENSDDASLGFVYISGGTIDIEAEGDGISAYAYAQIEGGTINLLCGGGSENASEQSSDNYGGFMGGMGGMGGKGGMGGGRPGEFNNQTPSTETTSDDSTSMKGIKATGSVLISDGTITVNSADDAIHANASVIVNGGTFEIATGDDGFHADEDLTVTGGKINITESYEGLEALDIAVSGGDIDLVASDDGLNAAGGTDSSGMGGRDNGMFGGMGGMGSSNGSIVISGGDLYVNASGDGIDANGYLEITGGYTVVVGPTQGDTATLDYDTTAVISGGTFIGTGASGMAQSFSDSENQGLIAVSVGNQSAGTEILLKDSDGNTVISYTPELNFAVVILSSPDIVKGETYTIEIGSSSGEFEAS